jgi:hypothetical protein
MNSLMLSLAWKRLPDALIRARTRSLADIAARSRCAVSRAVVVFVGAGGGAELGVFEFITALFVSRVLPVINTL